VYQEVLAFERGPSIIKEAPSQLHTPHSYPLKADVIERRSLPVRGESAKSKGESVFNSFGSHKITLSGVKTASKFTPSNTKSGNNKKIIVYLEEENTTKRGTLTCTKPRRSTRNTSAKSN
jgi:hypothetical protein